MKKSEVNLIADVLDKQICDVNGERSGKVDGLVIVLREGKPPRVGYIECGAPVVARRFGKHWERIALALNRWLGVSEKPRYRIPWSKVKELDIDVTLDFGICDQPPFAWERWLRDHIIAKVPFGR